MNGPNNNEIIFENHLGVVAGRLRKLQNNLNDLENKLNRIVLSIQDLLEEVVVDENLSANEDIDGKHNDVNTETSTNQLQTKSIHQPLPKVEGSKIRNRMVNTVDNDDTDKADIRTKDNSRIKKHTWKTCDYWSLPTWLQDNCYILKGYRPPLPSFQECFLSIFRIHTESGNIWTHLVGFILFVALFLHVVQSSLPLEDKFVLSPFFVGAVLCLGFSSSFHTLNCHSQRVSSLFNRLDYCGITLLIIGSFVPWLYYAFLCDSRLKILYIAVALALGTCTTVLSLSKRFSQPVYRAIRATVFVGLGLSGVIPGLHFIVLEGWDIFITFSAPLLLSATLYILGAVIYAARVPERIFPGKCDILFQSHQIFHVLVVVATLIDYFGLFRIAKVSQISRNDPNVCSLNQFYIENKYFEITDYHSL